MMLPKSPRTMELEPLRITELRALVAARLAMVLALVFLPPSTVLTMLVLTARITVAVAAAAAASAVFRKPDPDYPGYKIWVFNLQGKGMTIKKRSRVDPALMEDIDYDENGMETGKSYEPA